MSRGTLESFSVAFCSLIDSILSRKCLDHSRQVLSNSSLTYLQDKLMTVPSTESATVSTSVSWLFENKEHGKASAAASKFLAPYLLSVYNNSWKILS
jgi:hypothetical protein